jgi:predicted O-linked N-acetylglucosamine transferase (SPINDLY family)
MALAVHRQGRLREAEGLYRELLKVVPDHAGSLHYLGVLKAQQGKFIDATRLIRRAIDKSPRAAEAHNDLGVALESAKRPAEAISAYEQALALRADYPEAFFNLGNALQSLERHDEAIARFAETIRLRPGHAEAHNNLGLSLSVLGRCEEAVKHFETALGLNSRFADAESNLGAALRVLGRYEEAATHFARAIALKPDQLKAHRGLGNLLHELGRDSEALPHVRRALALQSANADLHVELAHVLTGLREYKLAMASYRDALRLDPSRGDARSRCVMLSRRMCDWSAFEAERKGLVDAIGAKQKGVSPFVVIAVTDDPEVQMRAGRQYLESAEFERVPALPSGAPRPRSERIRLAYLSRDLREHALSHLAAELFELHDRRVFEVVAFSWGPDDGSALRSRLERSFDRFVDVRTVGDAEIARQMQALGIDIALDLMGFTQDCRPGILARRPAPIQVNYLCYAASMGADFIDYAIVDPFVVPREQQASFTEKLVHLPDCYMATDTRRIIDEVTPTRAECGLPEQAFVFACFNNSYKITPPVFDVWMRLLQAVPGSVLWLLEHNAWATGNLRREARARGVQAERLVFAPHVPAAKHLARQRRADLALDTLPYNAHTTAIDALWAGLPLVTCTGRSFAARVAGSVLHAVGLPELVTGTLAEYEALAQRLARDPQLLGAVRVRLSDNRLTTPLFNSARYCRHLESAYREMCERWQRGEPVSPFAVPAVPN